MGLLCCKADKRVGPRIPPCIAAKQTKGQGLAFPLALPQSRQKGRASHSPLHCRRADKRVGPRIPPCIAAKQTKGQGLAFPLALPQSRQKGRASYSPLLCRKADERVGPRIPPFFAAKQTKPLLCHFIQGPKWANMRNLTVHIDSPPSCAARTFFPEPIPPQRTLMRFAHHTCPRIFLCITE